MLARGFLLLGAGASVKAKVPAALNFPDSIAEYLRSLPANAGPPLLDELAWVRKALGEPSKRVGLEPLFEALDDCLDAHFAGRCPPGPVRPSRAVERLHYEIKRVIQLRCDVDDSARVDYLDKLLPQLAPAPYPIISFNYDNVVETSCARLGMSFAEPVIEGDPKGYDIELIKVHGSVTWLPGREGKLERNTRYRSAILRRFGELRSPVLETPMVYPSRRKMPIHAPFIRNALRLQEVFKDQKRPFCIAVGYSFPDLHVRTWLSEAMRERPEMLLYLVNPSLKDVLRNLIDNSPTLAWTERLRILPMKFEAAIEDRRGFEGCLKEAMNFGPAFADHFEGRLWTGTSSRCFSGNVSGIGVTPDGEALFVSDSAAGSLVRIGLRAGDGAETFATGLKAPRGLSVAADGRVFVVQNRLFRWSRWPTGGAGNVVEIQADGRRRRTLMKLRLSEIRSVLREFRAGAGTADLWLQLQSVLRWPTDIALVEDGAVFVTEARALAEVKRGGPRSERVAQPELAFNLHGIDAASDGGLVGVEQGIGQEFSWGRVLRFERKPGGIDTTRSTFAEGKSRLMGLCFVPSIDKVVVTRCVSWPRGGLLVLDYPGLDNARFLGGFDFPQKVEYVPRRELLAIGSRSGVDLINVADLDQAVDVEPHPWA